MTSSSDPSTAEAERQAWEESYGRRENFVFYPHEEVIRFVARYLRRRIGFEEFVDIAPGIATARLLDVGCGIGRHLAFGLDMGLEMYGIDWSRQAIETARSWLSRRGVLAPEHHARVGDVRQLPWPDGFFDHALSHGVLDSMPFVTAELGAEEIARVLKPGSLFYCDLIAPTESQLGNEEVVVQTTHEQNTIQSYFDKERIHRLVDSVFDLEECTLTRRDQTINPRSDNRWSLILRRR